MRPNQSFNYKNGGTEYEDINSWDAPTKKPTKAEVEAYYAAHQDEIEARPIAREEAVVAALEQIKAESGITEWNEKTKEYIDQVKQKEISEK